MGAGSSFIKNPNLSVFGPFFVSFFELGKQILKILFGFEAKCPESVSLVFANDKGIYSQPKSLRICDSLIDVFTPLHSLIVGAISRQWERKRNGRRKKVEE